jgi:D-beta-D-heptose 7-phosphate kinase/D-beta-D-heptose 1-phosphate adenosyltransferase
MSRVMHQLPLKKILQGGGRLNDKYVPDYKDLARIITLAKESGYGIALTQGVFDMFHVGHLRYLQEARSHGDLLVVGVDSDELTRDMKDPLRPFDIYDERIEILAGIHDVSIITGRDVGQHKYDLIKLVRPDVLIMSKSTSSFTEEDKIALAEFCGKIEHLEAKAATSTTAKMRRILNGGAQALADKIHGKVSDFSTELMTIVTNHLKGDADGNH